MFDTKKVADTYDQIALNFSATRGKLSPELVSLLPHLKKEATVLDLGCGNGVLLTALPKDIAYLGIDISPVLVKEASRLHLEGQFTVADITAEGTWAALSPLPAGRQEFDFVAALAVFHHLPTPDDHIKLLQSIKQHLKPGGTVLISNWRLLQPKFERFRVDPKHLSIPFHQGPSRDFYAFTDTEVHEMVRDLGFRQTKTIIVGDNLYLTTRFDN